MFAKSLNLKEMSGFRRLSGWTLLLYSWPVNTSKVFGEKSPGPLQLLASTGTAGKHRSNIQRDVFRRVDLHVTCLITFVSISLVP